MANAAWGSCPALAPRLAAPGRLAGAALAEHREGLALRALSHAAHAAALAGAARLGLLAALRGTLVVTLRR